MTSMPISTGLTLGTVAMIQTNTDGDKRGREAGEERGGEERRKKGNEKERSTPLTREKNSFCLDLK